MKKTIFATILFLFILSSCALSFELIPVGFHWHTDWSDGLAAWVDKKYAISNGLMAVVFNDHSDMKIRETPDGFKKYKEAIEGLSDSRFIAIAGLELSIVKSPEKNPKKLPKTLCHVGWIGDSEDPPIYDHRYDWDNVGEVIKNACPSFENNACIAHHLKDCKAWTSYKYLSHFSGIELFNDLGIKSNYVFHRDIYLKANSNGIFYATAGADMHNYVAQSGFGKIVTYVCAEKFDRYSIEHAIFKGRTIATNNLKVEDINICPSIITQEINSNSFEIKGTVEIEKGNGPVKNLIVYKDGIYYKSIALKLKRKITVFNSEYSFYFSDVPSSQDYCYILEIEGHMITSPFCFRKTKTSPPQVPGTGDGGGGNGGPKPNPKEPVLGENILKVVNVYEDPNGGIEIVTENESKAHRFRFYNVCGKDSILFSDRGVIVSCRDPLFTVYRQDSEHEFALRSGRDCVTTIISKKQCIQALQSGYFMGIDESNFLAVEQAPLSGDEFYLVTEDKGIGEGEIFTACDPDGNFRFNDAGAILSCDKMYEMRARKVDGKELMRLDGAPLVVTLNAYFILLR